MDKETQTLLAEADDSYRKKNYEKALTNYLLAIQKQPNTAEASLGAGKTLIALNRPAEAEDHLEKSASKSDAPAKAHYMLGLIQLEKKEYPAAIENFKKALAKNPNLTTLHWLIGDALRLSENYEEAIPAYQEYLKHKPEDFEALLLLGYCLSLEEEYDSAIEYYSRAIDISPDSTEAYTQRGLAYAMHGKTDEAEADLERALHSDPRNPEIYKIMGSVHEQAGDLVSAALMYERSNNLKFQPDILKKAKDIREQLKDTYLIDVPPDEEDELPPADIMSLPEPAENEIEDIEKDTQDIAAKKPEKQHPPQNTAQQDKKQ
ncbi:Beta-barrel assembly-enhancing protease [uncultured archaeon]|nr:Beta-barrel assembly-enhancing protease [uncultured archaeon]